MLKKTAGDGRKESAKGTDRRAHLRPAKNFLGVLGRATRRLGIRQEESLIARAMAKLGQTDPHTVVKSRALKHNPD